MTLDSDSWTKACEGNCEWEVLPPCEQALDRFREEHEVAIEHLEELMDFAEGRGLLAADYSAPLGRRLGRRDPPWLGELKSDGPEGRRGHRQYRLYFGEAPLTRQALVAALLDFKLSADKDRVSRGKQTKQIKAAMNLIETWCKRAGHAYRKLGRQ